MGDGELLNRLLRVATEVMLPAERARVPDWQPVALEAPTRISRGNLRQVVMRAPNGTLDTGELLNAALAPSERGAQGHYEDRYTEALRAATALVVPWHVSPGQRDDPFLRPRLAAIDWAIVQLQRLNVLAPPPTAAAGERRLAIGLLVFLNADPERPLAERWQRMLDQEGLATFGRQIDEQIIRHTSFHETAMTPLGLSGIPDDAPIEATGAELLRDRHGWCSERSYLMRYAGRRAGLPIRFAMAGAGPEGDPDHLFNLLTLSDGTVLRVDVTWGTVEGTYPWWKPLDDAQAVAVYYGNHAANRQANGASPADVEAEYRVALQIDPTNAVIRANYAALLYHDGRWAEAMHQAEQALRDGGPHLISLQHTMARIWVARGQPRRALTHFRTVYRALRPHLAHYVRPDRLDYLLAFVDAAGALGRRDEVLATLRNAVATVPDRPTIAVTLAELLAKSPRSTDLVEAHGLFAQWLEASRTDAWLAMKVVTGYCRTAYALRAQAATADEAAARYGRAVTPQVPLDALYNHLLFLMEQRDWPEAERFAELVTPLPSTPADQATRAEIWSMLGDVHRAQAHLGPGIAAYRRALRLNPRDVHARWNLGVLYKQRGLGLDDPARRARLLALAERHFAQACSEDPSISADCRNYRTARGNPAPTTPRIP